MRISRVLVLHNRYRRPGGEDTTVNAEGDIMRRNGVEVRQVFFGNDVSPDNRVGDLVNLGLTSAWSAESSKKVKAACEGFRPDVAHVHNFWMRLSPSVHRACRDAGVPTVQTLHNFRLLCPRATLFREGKICEDCVGKAPWRGIVRRCYGDSYIRSAAVARMIAGSRRRGVWERDVDAFIALTNHGRAKFEAGGLPSDRIFVKPNFAKDPGPRERPSGFGTMLYVGRLSAEKGLMTLIAAQAKRRAGREANLILVGDGPGRAGLQSFAAASGCAESVRFLGQKSQKEVARLMAAARAVILPSIWYEGLPCVAVEAMSNGRPLIVSDLGALGEIVRHGESGLKFPAGDHDKLRDCLETVIDDDAVTDKMGAGARAAYLAKYTPERNFDVLMEIYRFAVQRAHERTSEFDHAYSASASECCLR